MDKKARVGVIGTGWWSTYTHIPGVLQNQAAQLVAVADINEEKLRAAAEHYNIAKTYTDYREMIARASLDGVVIATYHVTHYEIARFCLEHDLHIMLEKPMVLQASHGKTLVEIAAARQRAIILGYSLNYSPHALYAREIIRSGTIGEIQYANCMFGSDVWQFYNTEVSNAGPVHGPGDVYSKPELSGGGQGHLQLTHAAGLLFFLTDLRPKRVLALMDNLDAAVDVVNAITVEFTNGTLGNVGSYGYAGKGSRLDVTLYGSKGGLHFELNTGTVTVKLHDGADQMHQTEEAPEVRYPRFAPIDHLIDVCLGRAAHESSGDVGWRAVELIDAAYHSAALDGQSVMVATLYDKVDS